MKTLCVYSTRTGMTKQIAETIACRTGAELLRITDGKDWSGVLGYFGAAVSGLRKTLPQLLPYRTRLPLEQYDRIILCAPIWCENVCPVMRAFLTENMGLFRGEVCCVITHMSALSYEERMRGLELYLGREPARWLSVQTGNYDRSKDVEAFIRGLEAET